MWEDTNTKNKSKSEVTPQVALWGQDKTAKGHGLVMEFRLMIRLDLESLFQSGSMTMKILVPVMQKADKLLSLLPHTVPLPPPLPTHIDSEIVQIIIQKYTLSTESISLSADSLSQYSDNITSYYFTKRQRKSRKKISLEVISFYCST